MFTPIYAFYFTKCCTFISKIGNEKRLEYQVAWVEFLLHLEFHHPILLSPALLITITNNQNLNHLIITLSDIAK